MITMKWDINQNQSKLQIQVNNNDMVFYGYTCLSKINLINLRDLNFTKGNILKVKSRNDMRIIANVIYLWITTYCEEYDIPKEIPSEDEKEIYNV